MSVTESAVAQEPGSAIKELQSQMPKIKYPLKPSYMRPAVFKTTVSMVVTGMQPLAVVGDDTLSLEWIAVNKKHLQSIGAMIYVVSAMSAESIEHIRYASGISEVLVLPFDKDFAENLGVRYYPMLLDSAAGVIRQ